MDRPVDPLMGPLRAPPRPSRRRLPRLRWPLRLRIGAAVSFALHVLVLVLLLVTIEPREQQESLPPPSPVTMVFQNGGTKAGPSAPEPTPAPSLAAPQSNAPTPETEPLPEPPAPPPAPPPPAPTAETPPTPPVPPEAPPPPTPPVAETAPPTPPDVKLAPEPMPLPAPPPPPPGPEAEVPRQAPPTKAPPAAPPPLPVPAPPPKPAPRPRPPVLAQPKPYFTPPPSSKSSDFPAPMNFSFGGGRPSTKSKSQQAANGASQFSYGPVRKGAENNSPFADIEDDNGGPDWRNLLSRWVQQHAYYPPEARANLEEGYAKVHVEAGADGRVREVELIGRSGSVWLDMALLSLFRDQRIPQVPGGTTPIVFNFTMHYILIRR